MRRVIDIRYASIRSMDISNGEGVGVALFVQGCKFHCYNCFNPDTWDFNGGKEWSNEKKKEFIELIRKPYIKRVSILGGEPLADENLIDVYNLINEIRLSFGDTKKIWLYSGYTWEEIFKDEIFGIKHDDIHAAKIRKEIVLSTDVFVDGRYKDSLKDPSLKFKGSSNQRIIDMKKTTKTGWFTLWQDKTTQPN